MSDFVEKNQVCVSKIIIKRKLLPEKYGQSSPDVNILYLKGNIADYCKALNASSRSSMISSIFSVPIESLIVLGLIP